MQHCGYGICLIPINNLDPDPTKCKIVTKNPKKFLNTVS